MATSLRSGTLLLRSSLRRGAPSVSSPVRAYSSAQKHGDAGAQDIGPGKTHTVDKQSDHNVQAAASKAGTTERATSNPLQDGKDNSNAESHESQATTQKDMTNAKSSAKKEHPSAPEPIIGMNDERGGKGR